MVPVELVEPNEDLAFYCVSSNLRLGFKYWNFGGDVEHLRLYMFIIDVSFLNESMYFRKLQTN